jgi:hypothetical protein
MTVVMVLSLRRGYEAHQRGNSDERKQKLLHDNVS